MSQLKKSKSLLDFTQFLCIADLAVQSCAGNGAKLQPVVGLQVKSSTIVCCSLGMQNR